MNVFDIGKKQLGSYGILKEEGGRGAEEGGDSGLSDGLT